MPSPLRLRARRERSTVRTPSVLVVSVATVLGLLVGVPAASAETVERTLFSYDSEPGDFVGGGKSGTLKDGDRTRVSVTGSNDEIHVTVRGHGERWTADFAPGAGDTFHPGHYADAERFSFQQGRAPGMDINGQGGCNEVWGSFTINQIAFKAGRLSMLDLAFVQRCEEDGPAIRGQVLLDQLPLRYKIDSGEEDPLGNGDRKLYLGSTSIFTITADPGGVVMYVSGLRDRWSIVVRPPTGQELEEGRTYETTAQGDETHAGLEVSANSRGCAPAHGELTVDSMNFDDDGEVIGLAITFTNYCESAPDPLHGVLRVLA